MCVFYQVHHHVHRADFDRVDPVNKLPDLFEGGPVGGVMGATSPDQLRKHVSDKKTDDEVRDRQKSQVSKFWKMLNLNPCVFQVRE